MDEGTEKLVMDLENLYFEAKNKEFHDFENQIYPFPKLKLIEKLQEIIDGVKAGKYDNEYKI